MLQTVAMATNSLKDNHFLAIFHLFASFSRVSLGKIIILKLGSLMKTISDNKFHLKKLKIFLKES